MDNVKRLYICKKCGKEHRMGLENRETGSFEPLDICRECMIFGEFVPIQGELFEECRGTLHANIEGRIQNMAEYLNKQQAQLIKEMTHENKKDDEEK